MRERDIRGQGSGGEELGGIGGVMARISGSGPPRKTVPTKKVKTRQDRAGQQKSLRPDLQDVANGDAEERGARTDLKVGHYKNFSGLDEFVADCVDYQFGDGVEIELEHDVGAVGFGGVDADAE